MATKAPFNGVLACTCVVILASITIQMRNQPPIKDYLSQNISSTKPYDTFEDFYPHYLNELDRRLPDSGTISALAWSFCILWRTRFFWYRWWPVVCRPMRSYLCSSLDHWFGWSDPIHDHLSERWKGSDPFDRATTDTLLCGYGFSWIGHFAFEHNRPAAFVYPTYSLLGDFHMMYDAIRRQSFWLLIE